MTSELWLPAANPASRKGAWATRYSRLRLEWTRECVWRESLGFIVSRILLLVWFAVGSLATPAFAQGANRGEPPRPSDPARWLEAYRAATELEEAQNLAAAAANRPGMLAKVLPELLESDNVLAPAATIAARGDYEPEQVAALLARGLDAESLMVSIALRHPQAARRALHEAFLKAKGEEALRLASCAVRVLRNVPPEMVQLVENTLIERGFSGDLLNDIIVAPDFFRSAPRLRKAANGIHPSPHGEAAAVMAGGMLRGLDRRLCLDLLDLAKTAIDPRAANQAIFYLGMVPGAGKWLAPELKRLWAQEPNRTEALYACCLRLGVPVVLDEPLISMFRHAGSKSKRLAIARLLALDGDVLAERFAYVRSLASQDEAILRVVACRALSRYASRGFDVAQPLARLLQDKDRFVRYSALVEYESVTPTADRLKAITDLAAGGGYHAASALVVLSGWDATTTKSAFRAAMAKGAELDGAIEQGALCGLRPFVMRHLRRSKGQGGLYRARALMCAIMSDDGGSERDRWIGELLHLPVDDCAGAAMFWLRASGDGSLPAALLDRFERNLWVWSPPVCESTSTQVMLIRILWSCRRLSEKAFRDWLVRLYPVLLADLDLGQPTYLQEWSGFVELARRLPGWPSWFFERASRDPDLPWQVRSVLGRVMKRGS